MGLVNSAPWLLNIYLESKVRPLNLSATTRSCHFTLFFFLCPWNEVNSVRPFPSRLTHSGKLSKSPSATTVGRVGSEECTVRRGRAVNRLQIWYLPMAALISACLLRLYKRRRSDLEISDRQVTYLARRAHLLLLLPVVNL